MSLASPPKAPERRQATVVFADLVGFTALSEAVGTERAYFIVTRCLSLLDGIARRHGGAVDKFLGDALMAVFGHPLRVSNPEQRALHAAHEMRQLVRDYRASLERDLPLEVKIGVNTGSALFGDVGTNVRREFSILGDAVNVAARFKSKAPPGSVYLGAATRGAAGPGFAFRALPPLVLKGKAEPIPAFELLEAGQEVDRIGARTFAVTPLFGRETEQERLVESLERAAVGEGHVLAITGPAGIGKSRLVAEVAGRDASRELRWLELRAIPSGGTLHPFAPLVRRFARVAEKATPAEAREALRASLVARFPDEAPARRLAALGNVLGLPRGAEHRALQGLPPAALRSTVVTCVAEAIEELAARQPLVMVLEDWQWADPSSLELTARLARRPGAAVAWILTRQAQAGELLEAESVDTIVLDRLDDAASGQLVRALAEQQGLPPEVEALVSSRGAGHPAETVLSAFLGPALLADSERERRDRHRGREAERRRATVLFADLSGFTSLSERADPAYVYDAVTSCLNRMHAIAHKHGGSVDKHMGDCVMAVFGFPEAIEDAPRAAVNAAIEMRRDVAAFNRERELAHPLTIHTGIDTGLVIAGELEGSFIHEYALMGDPSKSAADLTDMASSGEIYVGPETWRATCDDFDYEPREAFQLAGQRARLASYELRSDQERLHRRRLDAGGLFESALVGRDEEVARIGTALSALAGGRGGIVSVVAEAGLGKSRLLAECRARAQEDATRWIEGRSLSIGRNLPFHLFFDVLRHWAGVADEDDEERAVAKVSRAASALLGDDANDVLPYVLTVMALPVPDSLRERVTTLEGDAMENLVKRALTQLLRRLAEERPLVLVLDDLHWADLSSIGLLEGLLRLSTEHAILFVHLTRSGFGDTAERILAASREHFAERHTEIHLQPLGAEACRALIRNLFRGADVPHAVRTALEERSAGNPFFVEEVVRSLLDEGALELDGGALRATERIGEVIIPGNVQEVVMARVDRLEPARRNVLQVASALGGSFEREVLAGVVAAEALDEQLSDLVASGLLRPAERAGGRRYEFKHPLIQEVAYDSIVETRRESLHREIGLAIEGMGRVDEPGALAMLAYHFGLGRDAERAETYLFRAGDEAARASASNEALHFFREASARYLELHGQGGDPRKKATLAAQIARAQSNRGQLLEAVSHYNQALEHLGLRVPGDVEMAVRLGPLLLAVLARLYWPGRRRPPADELARERIALMYDRAQAETTSSPARFVHDTMHVLRCLQKVDPSSVEKSGAIFASGVGTFAFGGVSFAVSRKFLERARPLVTGENRREVLIVGFMRFLFHFLEGDWSDEHALDPELVDEGIARGALWEVTNFLDLDTERRLHRGEFARVEQQLARIAQIVDEFQYDFARSSHAALTTYLQIERRELESALESADRYFDDRGEDSLQVLALGARAKAETLLGRLDDAARSLERAERVIERSGSLLPFHRSSHLRSRALLDVTRLERATRAGDSAAVRSLRRTAARSVKQAVASATRVASRQAEIYKLAGHQAWLAKRPRAALAWWRRALDRADALGARAEWARISQEAGRHLASGGHSYQLDGAAAPALLERARETFEALGLRADA